MQWLRSRSDRMLAGVCGGIGRSLGIDPVLIRVVMAVLILSGPGVIFYIAAWVLMPDEATDRSAAQGLLGDRIRPDHPWVGPIVVGAAVFTAIAVMSSFNFGRFLPGPVIVLAVIWLVARSRKGRSPSPSAQWAPAPQPATGGPATGVQDTPPPTGPSATSTGPSSSAPQRPQDRTVAPVQPVWTEDDPLGLYVDEPPAPAVTRPAEPPVKGVRGLKSIIVLLTGATIGIGAIAGLSTPNMLLLGIAVLGLGMLFGGFAGRTAALLPLGLLLAAGVAASTLFPNVPKNLADVNLVAPAGQVIGATGTSYTFEAGTVHLDLTKATFGPGAKVDVHGRAGDVLIKLPKDVDVVGQLDADLGDVNGLGQSRSGHNATLRLDDLGADRAAGPAKVTLDLDLKLGSIKVERG
ncbi:hypothetical protein GCM10009534_33790 [Kribbella sandramycini]